MGGRTPLRLSPPLISYPRRGRKIPGDGSRRLGVFKWEFERAGEYGAAR